MGDSTGTPADRADRPTPPAAGRDLWRLAPEVGGRARGVAEPGRGGGTGRERRRDARGRAGYRGRAQSGVEGFGLAGFDGAVDDVEDVEDEGDDEDDEEDEEEDGSAVDVVLDFSLDEPSFVSPPVFSEASAFLRASEG